MNARTRTTDELDPTVRQALQEIRAESSAEVALGIKPPPSIRSGLIRALPRPLSGIVRLLLPPYRGRAHPRLVKREVDAEQARSGKCPTVIEDRWAARHMVITSGKGNR